MLRCWCLLMSLCFLAACSGDASVRSQTGQQEPATQASDGARLAADKQATQQDATGPQVRIVTSAGTIELQLNKQKAPETVRNFVTYAENGFYDGTVFHRVIKDFVVQGGGFAVDVTNKQFYRKKTRPPIINEARNGLKNKRGTIAMARTNDPDSATSQFYINLRNNAALDYRSDSAGYCVFGHVTRGMTIVDNIAKARTGQGDWPVDQIVIKSVKLID